MKKRLQNSCSAMMIATVCIAVPVMAQTENSARNSAKSQQTQSNQMSEQSNNANASQGTQGNQLQEQHQVKVQQGGPDSTRSQNQIENQNQARSPGNQAEALQQQERLEEGHGEGQAVGGANRHKGQYKSQPSIERKSGPAGSKNKPQKSGSRGK